MSMNCHSFDMIIMSIVANIFVFLTISVAALNDYNYVLEKYTITPSRQFILKSRLCRYFNLLPFCHEFNRNRRSWNRLNRNYLGPYSRAYATRNSYLFDLWDENENSDYCECKCCKCRQPPQQRGNYIRKKRHTEEHIRKNKPYYIPLVRKKYDYLKHRRSSHAVVKRFTFNDAMKSVKSTAKKGFNAVKKTAEHTYDAVKDSAVDAYDVSKYQIKKTVGSLTPLEKCTEFLREINHKLQKLYNNNSLAQWNYEANLTDYNKKISVQSDLYFASMLKETSDKVKEFDKNQNCSSLNQQIKREIKFTTKLQEAALPPSDYFELQNLIRNMESIFSKALIPDFKNKQKHCHLDPDISYRMAHSRDPIELQYIWERWRAETGTKIKKYYPRYIELMNQAANLNGYDNVADMWLSVYESRNFEKKIHKVWDKIKPLYEQLHAYVRHKLLLYYGKRHVKSRYIPAHLLGNVFGQTWINIYNLTMPFPKHKFPDITAQLQSQGYTPLKMFEEAEKFFTSLNLPQMTSDFWSNSILEQKPGVQMVCHASAWDMYKKRDFRIKMCTHVTFEDFIVIHHEMGHVEYYTLYNNQPVVFREGANPGFHEAIGDTIALSVATPEHIKSLGLNVASSTESYENDINFLFLMALQKIAFLPYALVVEIWRWGVFRGTIDIEHYNKHWWALRSKYQGIHPPILRTEENFDAGAKYHIAAGVPYIRYFVSFVIQFQFHEALCSKAGKLDKPLHKCDIYKSQEAGAVLKEALSYGKSVPWPEIMSKLTGHKDIKANSLLKYFEPLSKWLQEENKKQNLKIGWGKHNINNISKKQHKNK